MSNIDEFNKATAIILSKIYESFPRRLSVQVGTLVEDQKDVGLYGDTIMFLVNEGFLTFESRSGNQLFNGLTLTGKGLSALNSTPDILQETTTLGQKISKAAKEGSKEVLTGLINTLIQSAVTGYIKAQG
jgi:hypothetical protein